VGDSSNWSACVLLHSRHASHCTILLISLALCTRTHTHTHTRANSHTFSQSAVQPFQHGVTPQFACRFVDSVALVACVCVCVCVRDAGVMDCRSQWRHTDICSAHPIKVSRIRSAVLFKSLTLLMCACDMLRSSFSEICGFHSFFFLHKSHSLLSNYLVFIVFFLGSSGEPLFKVVFSKSSMMTGSQFFH